MRLHFPDKLCSLKYLVAYYLGGKNKTPFHSETKLFHNASQQEDSSEKT